MKPGKNKFTLLISIILFFYYPSYAEEKIISTPLINLNELKPSFEEIDNSNNDIITKDLIYYRHTYL